VYAFSISYIAMPYIFVPVPTACTFIGVYIAIIVPSEVPSTNLMLAVPFRYYLIAAIADYSLVHVKVLPAESISIGIVIILLPPLVLNTPFSLT